MASCGALALQGPNPYLTGENASSQVHTLTPLKASTKDLIEPFPAC